MESVGSGDLYTAPIRKPGSISSKAEKTKEKEAKPAAKSSTAKEKVASTDYSKWDKYDADVEVLRIELEEERQRESVEIKNRRNQKMYGAEKQSKDERVVAAGEEDMSLLEQLSDIEKDKLSEG